VPFSHVLILKLALSAATTRTTTAGVSAPSTTGKRSKVVVTLARRSNAGKLLRQVGARA